MIRKLEPDLLTVAEVGDAHGNVAFMAGYTYLVGEMIYLGGLAVAHVEHGLLSCVRNVDQMPTEGDAETWLPFDWPESPVPPQHHGCRVCDRLTALEVREPGRIARVAKDRDKSSLSDIISVADVASRAWVEARR